MKKNYPVFVLAILMMPVLSRAQGWIGKSPDALIAYNSSLLNPVNVGIGTASPTAQLHTTGSVRLAGITSNPAISQILGIDANGNVFYRDAATLGANAWLLNGNAATNPLTNFLGTLDNNPVNFRTNNVNRMQLLADGGLRLRTIDNSNLLIRNSPNVAGEPDNIGIDFIRNDAPDNVSTNIKARIQFDGYPLTYTDQTVLNTGYIRFFTNNNTALNQRLVISPSGNVGIGSDYTFPVAGGIAVTRPFEVNCVNQPVRLRNLPSGTGNVLVIDANGDIRISNTQARVMSSSANEISTLQKQIDDLKKELSEIKSHLVAVQKNRLVKIEKDGELLQVSPNPSNGRIVIRSFIADGINKAQLLLTDMNGRTIKKFEAHTGLNTFTYDAASIANGSLICTVIANDEILADKKVIVSR